MNLTRPVPTQKRSIDRETIFELKAIITALIDAAKAMINDGVDAKIIEQVVSNGENLTTMVEQGYKQVAS